MNWLKAILITLMVIGVLVLIIPFAFIGGVLGVLVIICVLVKSGLDADKRAKDEKGI